QRELARLTFDRVQGLLNERVISRAEFDRATADYRQNDAKVGEVQAVVQRKTIRAPFSGILGIRQVNVGQYLEGGAKIVSLQALQPAFVNFTVPQQEMGQLRKGAAVNVTSDAIGGSETGSISAVDSIIDESTRHVRVQAVFDNRTGKLRPGMFVEAHLAQGANRSVIVLPASAIAYAPFGDSVYIIETAKDAKGSRPVRQQFVKLAGSRGDQVAVVSGVKAGEEVVTSGVFKLRPGANVLVNNAIQPSNSAAPKPEDS
ncbi:MAG TPA: efflux RND transporter periplasmic adaptor subunit, partial [Thermoanaerobaculia bacterium]|nr:efflux RND transporter periplasmic adaptor subunit [Thermoanaerobaculia bacterium]